jgi:hypothetical protein
MIMETQKPPDRQRRLLGVETIAATYYIVKLLEMLAHFLFSM